MDVKKSLIAKSSYSGFTLMETAIVVVVASLMLSGAVPLIKIWMDKAVQVANQQRLTAIQQALATYEKKFDKLPCPAPYTAGPGSPGYGRGGPDPCTAAPAGGSLGPGRQGVIGPLITSPSVSAGQHQILIGALPTRDLGLPDADIANTYGYRYTYAVTQSLTSTITTPAPQFPPNPPFLNPYGGAIEIKDKAGNDVTPVAADGSKGTALYVVVDHGADGKGAYTIDGGGPATACVGTDLDVANCNGLGTFVSAPFSKSKTPGNWFDDTVIFDTGANTKVCTTAFANSTSAGGSGGYTWLGIDGGFGAGISAWIPILPPILAIEIFAFWFDNTFTILPFGAVNSSSPQSDAYCPDASFHVVTGGCSDTYGVPRDSTGTFIATNADGTPVNTPVKGPLSNVFGGDIVPASHFQMVTPPLGHPVQNAQGFQGWECNGSSASGMYTQVYAVCCNR